MSTSLIPQGSFNYLINTYPARPNGQTSINFNREFESYQKKGGDQWTYLLYMILRVRMVFAGNSTLGILGRQLQWYLRQLQITNGPHDILLTGEFLQAYPYLNSTIYPFADPADIAPGQGDGAVREVNIVLPFYEPKCDDPYQRVDPVQRFIETNQQMTLIFAQPDFFDPTALVTLDSTVSMELVLQKMPKQFQAPNYVWRFEDRRENPFLINYAGVEHHAYGMREAQPQDGESQPFLPSHADLTQFTIEPGELSQPNTDKFAAIRLWEMIQKDVPSPDDVLASRYLDSVNGVDVVIPYVVRAEKDVLQHSQMPTVVGQQKWQLYPTTVQPERLYTMYVRPVDGAQAMEIKQNFRDPNGVITRYNPGGRPASDGVANTARIKLGPAPQTAKGVNSASKPVT